MNVSKAVLLKRSVFAVSFAVLGFLSVSHAATGGSEQPNPKVTNTTANNNTDSTQSSNCCGTGS